MDNVAPAPGPSRRSGCFPAAPYPPPRHGQRIAEVNEPQLLSGSSGVEDFSGSAEAQTLPRPAIQGMDVTAESLRRDLGQVGALGQVLPQQAVGVLVGSSLPGVVRMGGPPISS